MQEKHCKGARPNVILSLRSDNFPCNPSFLFLFCLYLFFFWVFFFIFFSNTNFARGLCQSWHCLWVWRPHILPQCCRKVEFAHSIFRLNNRAILTHTRSIVRGTTRPNVVLSLRNDGLTYNPSFSTINCRKAECLVPVTHVHSYSAESQVLAPQLLAWFFFRFHMGRGKCTLVFGRVRVLVSLLVRVVGGEDWKMLSGNDGWRKGLYRPCRVCTKEWGIYG